MTVDLLYSRTEFVQRYTTSGAAVLIIGGVIFGAATGWRMAALWLVGVALGFALHRAAYGFSAGFRALLRDQRTAHVRAQILMLAAAVVLFFPALVLGSVLGQPVRGFVFPLSAEVALGAFLFGIGMQIGGGCMSGTLYTVGGGSIRMAVTLAFAVAGATLAAFTADLWSGLPALPPVSLLTSLGLVPALALHLTIFALAWGGLALIERRRHGAIAPVWQPVDGPWSACVWPYAWAALALALLNFVTLLIAGRPWGITQAFALWGSQAVDALGLADPAFWTFWDHPTRAEALHRPFWRDTTTVMNVGVIIGAFLAAGLANSFKPSLRIPPLHLLASALGGMLLGAGAIIATGCNISAFFSGIASGSVHGWLWIAAALLGTWAGVHVRPVLKLDAPAEPASTIPSPVTS